MSFATNYQPDGWQVLNEGVDSALPPNTLSKQQVAFATNCTFRRGFPQQRPPFVKRTLKFLGADNQTDTTLRDNFQDNLFQGSCAFTRRNQICVSIGGRLFAIRISDFTVLDMSISGDLDRSDLRRAWLTEAEDFVIRQDNQAAPLIYDGSISRRADHTGAGGVREVPVGNVMAYSRGRLWVALPSRRSYMASDLVYGPTGTITYGRRDAVLKFDENQYWNGGGEFPVPVGSGDITAMAPIAQLDTSQGQGPLQVFTDSASFSVNAPTDRTQWQNLSDPIQAVTLTDGGASSDRATVNVNGDIWRRYAGGVGSLAVAVRDFGSWVNTPLSEEVQRALVRDDEYLLEYASAAVFDNRLLVTAAPYLDWDHGTCHRGFVVLDFAPVSSMRGRAQPVWEGAWSGLTILQVLAARFQGKRRCFIFALNSSDEIELWEILKTGYFDDDGTNKKKIQWTLESRACNWEDAGWELKCLETGDLFFDQIVGDMDWEVQYRPDSDVAWQDWHNASFCATRENCLTAQQCSALSNLQPQYRTRSSLPKPDADCDTVTGKPYRHGHEFQAKLTVTGAARLKKFRMWASPVPEDNEGACPDDETCAALSACPDDPFEYSIATADNA